jgi:bifunctional ADP-heptose synthase (sugar kinase/adenylyltransferase)
MSQAILNQIVNQLEMLEFFELQELERAIAKKYLADKQQATKQKQTQKSANKKQLFREWDAISDEEAALLKAEFAAEDLEFTEVALSDYIPGLQQQDKI